MKRIFALLLTLTLTFALASCDFSALNDLLDNLSNIPDFDDISFDFDDISFDFGDESYGTPENGTPEQSEYIPDGIMTVAGFLKQYGYTKEELMPEDFAAFRDVTLEGEPGEYGSAGFIQIDVEKEAHTKEEMNAWFDAVYAKMRELSKDGKLYKTYLLDIEATPLEELKAGFLWETLPGGGCFYPYDLNGKEVAIYVATSYDIENGTYKMSISPWMIVE